MKNQTVDSTKQPQKLRILPVYCLLALLLTTCSSSVPTPQSTDPASGPDVSLPVGSQPPVVLRVSERQEIVNGYLFYYQDIVFTDSDSDAVAITYHTISSSLSYPLKFPDAPIDVSAAEQRSEALFVETTACWQKMELVYESRIQDRAGNLSEPVLMTMSCTAPVPVDTGPLLLSGLSVVLPIGAVLLLVFLFLFRKHPAEKRPALRSTVLVFLVIMTIQFLQVMLHEGGHSLYLLVDRVPITLYVHTFFFSGFSRPLIPGSGISYDILGSAISLMMSFLITIPFWKRRSLALLPLVLLFPYSALGDGFNVMGIMGDFHNVIQSTGLPAALFFIPGALLMCIGMLSFFSLLPLAGLDPGDNKALFVLPAAMWLISILSLLVAHLVVPGSPIDLEYFAGREILLSVNNFLFLYIGIVLAVLYVTLFRWLYPRLPAWLRTETVNLTWKDLRLPGILWAFCVIIGLIIII
jgi:hypothetical protein